MWALVKANQVIKIFNGAQAFEHNDIKHPANIFSSWSAEEKAAIGIYPIQEDRSNVSKRLREGWELVRGTDLPTEFVLPTMEEGRHAGIVYNDGLLLAKIPVETKNERNTYYEGQTAKKREALDNNMFNESRKDSRYVQYDSKRESNVTFGKK